MSQSTIASGVNDYLQRVRSFSYNAKLYLVHIAGMDMIRGTWDVLFNLYLLLIGVQLTFGDIHIGSVQFIGLRLAVGGIASAIASLPAGFVSDRIGRKASFVLGDGMGAVIYLLNILTLNPWFLLLSPILSSGFGTLHHVSESAFMAENSESRERIHLFGVSMAGSTLAAMVGSVLAGLFPLLFIGLADKVTIYRIATYFGIALWFLSLIPALLLRDFSSPAAAPREAHPAGLRGYLSGIKHPRLMLQLAIPSALITLGGGFVLPLMNVFFHQHMHMGEMEIGSTFAISSAFVAVGALLAPVVAARLDRVNAVTLTRLLSVPFILMLGFAASMGESLVPSLSIAGLAFVARAVFMNMSFPIENAFEMELLDRQERATYVGVESTIGSALRALAGLLGASLMGVGDFQTPFLIMAALTLGSTVLYYMFFRKGVVVPQVAPVGTA